MLWSTLTYTENRTKVTESVEGSSLQRFDLEAAGLVWSSSRSNLIGLVDSSVAECVQPNFLRLIDSCVAQGPPITCMLLLSRPKEGPFIGLSGLQPG